MGEDVPQLTKDSALQTLIDALSLQERHIRYQLSGEWYYQFTEPKTASAATSWLGPNLHIDRMFKSEDAWFRFWMTEASLQNMPTDHLLAAVERFQQDHKIEIGNTVDRVHAGYLHQFDYVVTADQALYDIMVAARSIMPTRGRPLLVHRGAGVSALAELQNAVP